MLLSAYHNPDNNTCLVFFVSLSFSCREVEGKRGFLLCVESHVLHTYCYFSCNLLSIILRFSYFRYVALNMLMKAIAVDSQAVQRHRATILECVKVCYLYILLLLLIKNNNLLHLVFPFLQSSVFFSSHMWSPS